MEQLNQVINAGVSDVIKYIFSDGFYIQTGNPRVFRIPEHPNGRITFSESNFIRSPATVATISGCDISRENIATE